MCVCETRSHECVSISFQALIYANTSPNLEIELFDEDTDKDDFLGRYGSGGNLEPTTH